MSARRQQQQARRPAECCRRKRRRRQERRRRDACPCATRLQSPPRQHSQPVATAGCSRACSCPCSGASRWWSKCRQCTPQAALRVMPLVPPVRVQLQVVLAPQVPRRRETRWQCPQQRRPQSRRLPTAPRAPSPARRCLRVPVARRRRRGLGGCCCDAWCDEPPQTPPCGCTGSGGVGALAAQAPIVDSRPSEGAAPPSSGAQPAAYHARRGCARARRVRHPHPPLVSVLVAHQTRDSLAAPRPRSFVRPPPAVLGAHPPPSSSPLAAVERARGAVVSAASAAASAASAAIAAAAPPSC